MSAGVCGKRVGFEEIFGSSGSSAKRSRCSTFGSPVRSADIGSGSDDPLSALLDMFPALDHELVKTIFRNNNNKIEDAIESLRVLSVGDAVEMNKSPSIDSTTVGSCTDVFGQSMATCSQISHLEVEPVNDVQAAVDYVNMTDGSKWVDLFVHEMTNARDIDDAKGRAARILEAFEEAITANSRAVKEVEYASLKEHLRSLLNDNQILKRAVAIQCERNFEQEEKTKEVQHLKLVLGQYQEQVRNLELNNYALKLHLQRAQESRSFHGHFPPDIY